MVALRLFLVRHGATDWSDAGRFNGTTDVPLNERGRDQAERLAHSLLAPSLWSSDLSRARATAEALGEPTVDPRLRELDFGELEGKTWMECSAAVRRALLTFEDFVAPGGESVAELATRAESFVAELPPGDHVIVTHGGVIRLLLRRVARDRHVAPGEVVSLPLGAGSLEAR